MSNSAILGCISGIIVSLIFEVVGINMLANVPGTGAQFGWAFIGGGSIGLIASIVGLFKSF